MCFKNVGLLPGVIDNNVTLDKGWLTIGFHITHYPCIVKRCLQKSSNILPDGVDKRRLPQPAIDACPRQYRRQKVAISNIIVVESRHHGQDMLWMIPFNLSLSLSLGIFQSRHVSFPRRLWSRLWPDRVGFLSIISHRCSNEAPFAPHTFLYL